VLLITTLELSCHAKEQIQYTVSIIGLQDFPDIEIEAQKLSQLLNPDSSFSIESEGIIRDVLQDDITRIRTYLESYGFYDVKLFSEIETITAQEYKITLHVDVGERYIVNHIKIYVNGQKFIFDKHLLFSQKDSPIINELIIKDKNKITLFLKQNGYAVVETLDEQVEIDHEKLLANITYRFKTGPKGIFGSYKINGLKSIHQTYIEKFIRWKSGEPYNVDYINQTEQLLLDTGLFETLLITPSDLNEANEFTININVTERKPNHLQFGVYGNIALSGNIDNRYEIGFMPKYVHNNVAGSNEKFEVNAILSNVIQDINLSLRKPHLLFFNTAGRVFFSGERRTYDAYAYSRLGIDGGVGIDYKLMKSLVVDLRVIYERYSLERKTNQNDPDNYNFVGFPINLRFDTRENKIFSDTGLHINIGWTPYLNLNSKYTTLHQLYINGAFYFSIIPEYLILASWGRWDCLSGTSFENSPMDKRVYLGDSQNLRGYLKDSLGNSIPLENQPEKLIPQGGMSGIAVGLEPRFRVYHQLWAAIFLDAGHISKKPNIFDTLHSTSDLYWDIGLSIFYFTNFGPLRFDIAYPLGNKIDDNKKEFKFYISFGQAF
jgi:translocation and assembly module TamA